MKSIKLSSYNNNWPLHYKNEATLIKEALTNNLIEIHHIGSTSIPGCDAKPIIDIIASAKNLQNTVIPLQNIGYDYKGEWNIPRKYGFDKKGDIDFHLHFFPDNHPEITANLLFRDYIIEHPQAMYGYISLKNTILLDKNSSLKNKMGMKNYTLKKGDFIRNILQQADFKQLRILKVNDYSEQDFVTKYCKDFTHNIDNINYCYLILYQGYLKIGYAEIYNNILQKIYVENISLKNSFIKLIHDWLDSV